MAANCITVSGPKKSGQGDLVGEYPVMLTWPKDSTKWPFCVQSINFAGPCLNCFGFIKVSTKLTQKGGELGKNFQLFNLCIDKLKRRSATNKGAKSATNAISRKLHFQTFCPFSFALFQQTRKPKRRI